MSHSNAQVHPEVGHGLSGHLRRTTLLLILLSALALVLRVSIARYHPIDHNGGWHLFVARNFTREWTKIAHPPLFLLLLKACDTASHTLFAYRFLPILASVGSVFLVGRTLQKLGTLPIVALLGALTFACAQSSILLSFDVEGYTLCVLFVLACFFYYLDIVSLDQPVPARSRLAFSAFACLALLSHYFAGLFLTLCVLGPLVAMAIRPGFRQAFWRALPRRLSADFCTLLPPMLVAVALYLASARPWVRSLSSLPLFYFQAGEETVTSFWIRNLRDTYNLFGPHALPRARYALPPLALFLGLLIWAPATEKPRPSNPGRLLPAIFLTLLLAFGMVLGLLGRYPFGGEMRHQFLLFVFATLAGYVALDRLARALPSRARVALAAVCTLAIGYEFATSVPAITIPVYGNAALVARRGIFRRELAGRRAVHVDGFNMIGMMMDYYNWEWRFEGRDPANPSIERYVLSRDGNRLRVAAHRSIWIMDFRSAALYSELRIALGRGGDDCETVFCVDRNLYWLRRTKRPEGDRRDLARVIPDLAAAAGLTTRSLVLGDDAIDVEFCDRTHVKPR